MTDKYKSIVAPVWAEFVAELKRTVGEGKQSPQRLLYQHSFFKAVMLEGENQGFVKCLESITGNEVNVLELVDKLLESANVKTVPQNTTVVEQNTPKETPSSTVSAVEKQRDNAVEVSLVKSKPSRVKRGSKGGQQ